MDLGLALASLVVVNVLAWLTPGPNMLAVMNASMTRGRRHGIAVGLGLSFGGLIWSTLAVLGVGILFELFPRVVLALKLVGAAYLIWLGIRSVRSARNPLDDRRTDGAVAPSSAWSALLGLTISLTNPKAALFFIAVMTTVIPEGAPSWFLGVVLAVCFVMGVGQHAITATVFSTSVAMRAFDRFKAVFAYAFGAVFASLGGAVVYDALRRAP